MSGRTWLLRVSGIECAGGLTVFGHRLESSFVVMLVIAGLGCVGRVRAALSMAVAGRRIQSVRMAGLLGGFVPGGKTSKEKQQ